MKASCALAAFVIISFANFLDAQVVSQPPELEPGDEYRLIFTTSQRRDATSDDINVYNEFVQSVADSSPELAALGLEWRAVGWTSSVNAIDNTLAIFTEEDPGLPIVKRRKSLEWISSSVATGGRFTAIPT